MPPVLAISGLNDANLGTQNAPGYAFNIGCGERHSLLELVKYLNEIHGKSIEPILSEPRKGDVKHSLADITSAKSILGYQPKVTFEKGLSRYCFSELR